MEKLINIESHMSPNHIMAFQNAAKTNSVYILVRRTNPESIKYIGKTGYIGKRIDCKPKTADFDTGNYKRKGLVVNPYLVGEAAFKTNKKHTEAKKAWDSFRKKCVILSSNDISNVNAQHREAYFLDEDKSSQHYGCVMFTSDWSIRIFVQTV